MKYLALLRGINVGGKNIISKEELRDLFEGLGFKNIKTYIQSGNIFFITEEKSLTKLTSDIEQALSQRFSYAARAVVYSQSQYETMLGSAPEGWGTNELEKHNALFLIEENSVQGIIEKIPAPKPNIESITVTENVIFWSISKEHQTKTSYMKLSKLPFYKEVTIRNHNTVSKLQKLFSEI